MAHSIHRAGDRANPYVVYGFNGTRYSFEDVTYPQSTLFCETCHTQSAAAPQGDDWLSNASAASCGGCHDAGLAKTGPDAATGRYTYTYEHTNPPVVGPVPDGSCVDCHREGGAAGSVLAAHDRGERLSKRLGEQFVYEILDVTNVGLDEVPNIRFRVSRPDGSAYDIVNDPAFTSSGANLNLNLAWDTRDISNAKPDGTTPGLRSGTTPEGRGYTLRMSIAAIRAAAAAAGQAADGSYTIPYFTALPVDHHRPHGRDGRAPEGLAAGRDRLGGVRQRLGAQRPVLHRHRTRAARVGSGLRQVPRGRQRCTVATATATRRAASCATTRAARMGTTRTSRAPSPWAR